MMECHQIIRLTPLPFTSTDIMLIFCVIWNHMLV